MYPTSIKGWFMEIVFINILKTHILKVLKNTYLSTQKVYEYI